MKNVMKKAHEITRNIIRKGDSYKATFRLALSLAHSLIKKGVKKMLGSEKQVKWATDIKEEATKLYNTTLARAKEVIRNAKGGANKEKFESILNKMEVGYKVIIDIEEASVVITYFKNIKITDFLFATDFNYLQGEENKQIYEDFRFFNLIANKINLKN